MKYLSFWDCLTPLGKVVYVALILTAIVLLVVEFAP